MTLTHIPAETKVALLAGGRSGEREISLASGQGALAALTQAGYHVTLLDTAKPDDLVSLIRDNFDVAFLALHGKFGEDGTVQGMLEMIGMPYIGSGVWSSATAIDKAKAKVYYERESIPTPTAVRVTAEDRPTATELMSKVGNKCVAKPATEGSALGVFIVDTPEALEDALDKTLAMDKSVLVETYVAGTEFTVAVLGTEDLTALPVIQIVPCNDFYDFEAKYAEGGSQHLCPAPISAEETARAQELALKAHRALSCAGVSRTDLIKDESGAFWVLETNTIPGMTATSLLPDAAQVEGIPFPDLCSLLIEDALTR